MDATSPSVRVGGGAAVVAGVAGAVIGLSMLVVPPAVPAWDYSFPLSYSVFAVVQTVLGVHHAALALGLWVFWRSGLAGRTRAGAIGAWLSIVPTAVLAVWEVVAISGAGQRYPSEETAWLDTGYGVLTILSGTGLVVLGVAAARARVLAGPSRWLVLTIGIWVFMPMLPAIFAGFVFARVALSIWSLLFAALGIVLLRSAGPARAGASRRSERVSA